MIVTKLLQLALRLWTDHVIFRSFTTRAVHNISLHAHNVFLCLKFRKLLRQLDGGHKVESEAKQITADVNKFLKFACPKGKDLMWVDLLNEQMVRRYIDMLNTPTARGPSGQLSKLDQITHALRYLRLRMAGQEDASLCNVMKSV